MESVNAGIATSLGYGLGATAFAAGGTSHVRIIGYACIAGATMALAHAASGRVLRRWFS